jgi:hypothetical protein
MKQLKRGISSMPHVAIEIFYFVALGLFLLGAAFSFRSNGSLRSVLIMSCGVAADMALRLLPMGGFASLPENMGVTNSFIIQAIAFGMLTVWPAFFLALLFRRQRHRSFFHWLIAGIELVWFLDVILLLYGLYVISPGR